MVFSDDETGVAKIALIYRQSCERCASLHPEAPHATSTVFLQSDGDADMALVFESTQNESVAKFHLEEPKCEPRHAAQAAPARAARLLYSLSCEGMC